jgi:hypothetical protein
MRHVGKDRWVISKSVFKILNFNVEARLNGHSVSRVAVFMNSQLNVSGMEFLGRLKTSSGRLCVMKLDVFKKL